MLTDPENFEEWELEVRAMTLDEARMKCRRIADGRVLTELINVSQVTKTKRENGYRFCCWFRTEMTPDDSSDS